MRGWSRFPALLGALALVGCGARLEPEPTVELAVIADVAPAAPRTVLAVVTPYTRADVSSLVVRLFTVDGTTEAQVAARTLSNAELDRHLTFGTLKPNRTYRVRGTANAVTGTTISDPATSFVDIVVGMDASPPGATLPVRLIDKVFNGRTTSAPMAVTDGILIPAGIETMSQ